MNTYTHIYVHSIAGMVRTDYDTNSMKDMSLRTTLLFKVAKELKWLSDIHKVCVVVINQVILVNIYVLCMYMFIGIVNL